MSKINPIILSDIKTISDDETISEDEYSEKDEQLKLIFFYLVAKSTTCKYKVNNQFCNGQAKLRRIIINGGEEFFIGCDKWIRGEKWHQYIKIDVNNKENQCCTLVSRASRIKLCEFPHVKDNQVIQETIIERTCNVQFIEFIPYDLATCPYIALVCIDDSVTPRSIIAKNNSIKAIFDKDTLSEVHASLNNVEHLLLNVTRICIPMYREIWALCILLHSVQCKKFDIAIWDGQTLILCMLDFQAKALQNLKCFQIDLTFKRVQGDINEFEVNSYDEMHKPTNAYQCLFTQLFEVIENLSEKPVKFIILMEQLEIEECKMKLAERRTADRKAQAEIEKLELENLKLRKELNM
ncbi:hypothetical protein RhiirC2_775900 [Rhizophagus irregularis]|uniref:Uncharacterized protein n=1 Tax=Rhizophagus irregularis TaxID=588596 RepID=A0A2N1NHY9_9GLOM|nr:hypothetical protein RhiirC2_775900 [Rhizophagus irregularis]